MYVGCNRHRRAAAADKYTVMIKEKLKEKQGEQGEEEDDRIINTTATTITMGITMFFTHIDDR